MFQKATLLNFIRMQTEGREGLSNIFCKTQQL